MVLQPNKLLFLTMYYLRINACFLSLYQVELFHHYIYDSYVSYDSFLNVMKNTEKKIYNYI